MKTKSIFCSALLFIAAYTANGQWTGTPTSATVYTTNTTANVGFGTTAPAHAFEVARTTPLVIGLNRTNVGGGQKSEVGFFKNGTAKWTIGTDMWNDGTNNFYIWNGVMGSTFQVNANGSGGFSGNLGIGTTSPTAKLDVRGVVALNSNALYLRDGGDNKHGLAWKMWSDGRSIDGPVLWGLGGGALGVYNGGADKTALSWNSSGNVNIGSNDYNGTTHADYRLSVDGKVIAPSFYALAISNWSDFVFDENYKLTPLEEVEKFVKENKHLPEIPSTKEVQANGINLQEMDALLLMKVEELTLHLIEMQKEMKGLKAENATLKTSLEEITK